MQSNDQSTSLANDNRGRTSNSSRQNAGQDTTAIDIPPSSEEQFILEDGFVSDQAAGYYEPVGELVKEHEEQRSRDLEIALPQPVESNTFAMSFRGQEEGGLDPGSQHRDLSDNTGSSRSGAPTLKRKATDEGRTTTAQKHQDRMSSRHADTTTHESSSANVVEQPQALGSPDVRSSIPINKGQGADTATIDVDMDLPMAPDCPDINANDQKATPRRRRRTVAESQSTSSILPARKVFPIQIGSELFRLSGASISSDGESLHRQATHMTRC